MPDEKIIKAKRHILQETDGVKEYATVSQYTLADSVEFDNNNAIKNGLSLSESLWEGTKEEYEADYIAGKIAEGATVHITDDHEDVEQDPINIDDSMSSSSENPVQNKVITTALTSEINRATNAESTLTNSINTESSRAKSAETSLGNRITAIENLESGWNNKYSKEEIDAKFSALETATDWKEAVPTFADIATTYPNPQDGWTVNVKDTDYTYRYDGSKWIATSANAIPDATQSISGKMSASDKAKLDSIVTGAEVNQNAFSNVVIGSTTIEADNKTDTLTFVAGSNVTITPDATNDKITIDAKDTTYTANNGVNITGTNITNSGVRSISEGSADGSISVNTNGSSSNVSVHGLKSGAFTNYVIGTKSQIESATIPVGSIVDITDDYDSVDGADVLNDLDELHNDVDRLKGGRLYIGTAITGTSTTDTVFSNSGIEYAYVGDIYINNSNDRYKLIQAGENAFMVKEDYSMYECTNSGDASNATWVYKGYVNRKVASSIIFSYQVDYYDIYDADFHIPLVSLENKNDDYCDIAYAQRLSYNPYREELNSNLSGYAGSAKSMYRKYLSRTSTDDLNELPNLYAEYNWIYGAYGNSCLNKPSGVDAFSLEQQKIGAGTITDPRTGVKIEQYNILQKLTSINGVFYRQYDYSTSTWSDWKQVITF